MSRSTTAADPGDRLDRAIARTLAGDVDAFAEVVACCDDGLRRYLVVRAPSPVDIEEIVQRSFIAAFDRLGTFQRGRSFSAWLQGIARHELLHELRNSRRRAQAQARAADQVLCEQGQHIAEAGQEGIDEQLDALERCLERLDPPARELVELRYRRDWPVTSIADHTRRPAGTIRRQLFSLRRVLFDCVKRGGVG